MHHEINNQYNHPAFSAVFLEVQQFADVLGDTIGFVSFDEESSDVYSQNLLLLRQTLLEEVRLLSLVDPSKIIVH